MEKNQKIKVAIGRNQFKTLLVWRWEKIREHSVAHVNLNGRLVPVHQVGGAFFPAYLIRN